MQHKNLVNNLHPTLNAIIHIHSIFMYINTKYLATIFTLGNHMRAVKTRTEQIYLPSFF